MKIVILIARLLLGAMFTVFGLNGFLQFLSLPAPTGIAGQYMGSLFASHYLAAVFALEVFAGALLLANRFVPLALAILAPILVNIALFHTLMVHGGFGPPVLAIACWAVLAFRERTSFAGLFAARGIA